jgi:membrane-associated phospholipid phosphatase
MGIKKMGFESVFAGFIFSQAIQLAKTGLSRTGLFLAFVVILGFILYGFKWFVARKGKQFLSNFASFGRSIKAAAVKNERVALWIQKHPRSVSFLKARFDASTFSGLPLTLLTLSFVYVASLFAGLVEDLITSDTMVATDHRIANLLSALRTGALTDVFTWITLLGNVRIILAFLAVSVGLLWLWRKRYAVLPLLISAAGSTAFTYLGKLTFQRPRPETAVYAAHSFSFPSGHATIAVAFYGFAGYLIARTVPQWNKKVNLVFAAIVLIAALGFSRMYLGEHYLSDVLSGYLVGAMWLIIAISLSERLRQKAKGDRAESPAAWARPISWGLVFAAVAFYVAFALTYRPPPAATEAEPIVAVRKSTAVFTNAQPKYTRTLTGDKQEPINFIFLGGHDTRLRPARRIKRPADGRAGPTTAAPCCGVRRLRTKKSADILLKYRNGTDTHAARAFLLLTEKDHEDVRKKSSEMHAGNRRSFS